MPSNRILPLLVGLFSTLALALPDGAQGGDLRVATDFEGGSATVESIDQSAGIIRITPGGDPQRGWPCWWYLRIEGAEKDRQILLNVGGSDLPARNNGQNTGKPLSSSWALPLRAAISLDGKTWQQTPPGRRDGARMIYQLAGTGGLLWVAWGPPFTPRDTDALIGQLEKDFPAARAFELARSREGRPVRGVRFGEANASAPVVWIQARQHAWESGASWVARGLAEWLASDGDEDAAWLRNNAEILLIPIMDVDNVATGNGGKEEAPRDHNRDWDGKPVFPEVAAAQKQLRQFAEAGRLAVFLELHNPAPGDLRPFFFMGPDELLSPVAKQEREAFLRHAVRRINGPLPVLEKPKFTGPGYHPLWRQIANQWVDFLPGSTTVAVCLEVSWNTPFSTTEGYKTVGRQTGTAVAGYLRERLKTDGGK